MKGIILAGGSGSRLYPLTNVTSKQLLPIYDKPMIYYPLSILMLSEIKDILIISTPNDLPRFKDLLGDGSDFGIHLEYKVQEKPNGLAEAFLIGESFIGNDCVSLILGDNIFYGHGIGNYLMNARNNTLNGLATIFGYFVNDPERFGVIGFDESGKINSIEEKPIKPKSNYAVTGLYFYDNSVINIAKEIKPSKRGELEITSVNEIYLKNHKLETILLGRGFTWLDTGTFDSLIEASEFVKIMQANQGIVMSCPEEIAYKKGRINKEKLLNVALRMQNNSYGKHLLNVVNEKIR
ncbi:MAG: glucose-1-phosphate thymidylyltransferase RfbA [Firmicutes bacterium]|uniref:Glucose-1-phosphate thymidylyltransferase n=1 Tax=Candidatus Onthovivens merdipullorum TaxID=2840889 RepID=A0A9D9GXW7_9BACL|nr:glucose-1-phosphate thymidylyltransferase RfbA [Candidatus Onthovivens merdipullorum]